MHNVGVSALLLLRLRLLGLPRLGLRPGAAVLLAQEVAAGNVKPACLSAVDALLALALPARDKRLMSAAKTASSHESSIIIDQLGCAGHCPPSYQLRASYLGIGSEADSKMRRMRMLSNQHDSTKGSTPW